MSKILAIIKLSFLSLGLHKLRSALTILGIIFGVASVITMLAVGEGASEEAQKTIRELGSNNIIVTSVKEQDEEAASSSSRTVSYGVTYEDVSRIWENVPNLKKIAKKRIIQGVVSFRGESQNTTMIPCDVDLFSIRDIPLKKGRFFTSTDDRNLNLVCVIDKQIADTLFPYQDPLECKILYRKNYLQVVGVVNEGEAKVYVPWKSWEAQFGELTVHLQKGTWEVEQVDVHEMILQLEDAKDVLPADRVLRRIMKYGHTVDDYAIKVPIKLLEKAEETKRMFNYLLGAIAGISLLVGGIGIMNIMLATVSERTKEIGLRRAIGARKKDIILQFMVEAIVLSLIGGLIGVCVGIAFPWIITYFWGVATSISTLSVISSFLISGITGVLFGSYPAIKSANLNPIEALRDG